MVSGLVSKVPRPESRFWTVAERTRWVPLLLLVGVLAQCTSWLLDRSPPFAVLSYTAYPAKAGGVLEIHADVRRDLDRDCYVQMSSSIFDSTGVRWDFGTTQTVSPQGIRDLDAKTPGKLISKVKLPTGMAPGPASLLSSMVYQCNPLHDLFRPISVDTRFDFEVMP